MGKYSFMNEDEAAGGSTYKEWTLKRELEDAKTLILEYQSDIGKLKESNLKLESDLNKQKAEN